MEKEPWLRWYDLEGEAAEEAGVEAILWIDDRSWAGAVDELDRMLRTADASRLPVPVVLDMLSETIPFRTQLPSRESFVAAARVRLAALLGQERAEHLMKNRVQ